MLTDQVVKQLSTGEKDYKRGDSGGLYIFVATTGRKTWRLKYRQGGKEKRLVLGTYPEMSLKAARIRRDEVKLNLREGKDPARSPHACRRAPP